MLPSTTLRKGHSNRNLQQAPHRLHSPSLLLSTGNTKLVKNLVILPSNGPFAVSGTTISPRCAVALLFSLSSPRWSSSPFVLRALSIAEIDGNRDVSKDEHEGKQYQHHDEWESRYSRVVCGVTQGGNDPRDAEQPENDHRDTEVQQVAIRHALSRLRLTDSYFKSSRIIRLLSAILPTVFPRESWWTLWDWVHLGPNRSRWATNT